MDHFCDVEPRSESIPNNGRKHSGPELLNRRPEGHFRTIASYFVASDMPGGAHDYRFKWKVFVKYSMILWNALNLTSMRAY